MTIAEYLQQATIVLRDSSDSPRLDTEVLLAYILKQDRAQILINKNEAIDPILAQQFKSLILNRAHHVPVPYLTGRQEFFGLSLEVTPDVLIPRPATELLVEAVLRHLPAHTNMTIADIGTGSGAIALALAKHLPQATIIASDISAAALAVAKNNAQRLGLADRITFLQSSLLKSYKLQPNFLVSNLPYLTPAQMSEPSIQHEPRLALDGGEDGLDVVNQLIGQVTHWPTIGGIALELDPHQVDQVMTNVKSIRPDWLATEISDGHNVRGMISWKQK